MREMDYDGLILCDIQGKLFELSVETEECSSNIFIRRFMNSKVAVRFDNATFLNESTPIETVLDEINEQYGKSTYGSIKFSKNEMFWIGYIYRYMVYVYEIESMKAYKIIKGKELRNLYLPYHTLDPLNAIDRILEAKNINLNPTREEKIARGVEILRKIRNERK
ncbi:MAG: antitoxin [Erysipelotrichaceae bacterium]|nr:antitoxin [Erysipelotrichaceae bacterium]